MRNPVVNSCRKLVDNHPEIAARAQEVRPRLRHLRVERDEVTGEAVAARASVTPNPKMRDAPAYEAYINFSARTRKCSCAAHERYPNKPCKHVVAMAAALLEVFSLMVD